MSRMVYDLGLSARGRTVVVAGAAIYEGNA